MKESCCLRRVAEVEDYADDGSDSPNAKRNKSTPSDTGTVHWGWAISLTTTAEEETKQKTPVHGGGAQKGTRGAASALWTCLFWDNSTVDLKLSYTPCLASQRLVAPFAALVERSLL